MDRRKLPNLTVMAFFLAMILLVVLGARPLQAQNGWQIHIKNIPAGWAAQYVDIFQGKTLQCTFGRDEGVVNGEGRLNASFGGPLSREEIRDTLVKRAEYESVHGSAGKWSPPQAITLQQSSFTGFIITAGPNFASWRNDYAGYREAKFDQQALCYVSNGKVAVEIHISALAGARGEFNDDAVREKGGKFWNASYDLLKGLTVTGPGVSEPVVKPPGTPPSSAVLKDPTAALNDEWGPNLKKNLVFYNGNDGGVINNGRSPAFTITKLTDIYFIMNYHYNGGAGAAPGTISFRESKGRTYGPWQAAGAYANKYWIVRPGVQLPVGSYTIIDSDPATWSCNAQSGMCGHSIVKGQRMNLPTR